MKSNNGVWDEKSPTVLAYLLVVHSSICKSNKRYEQEQAAVVSA